MPNGSKINRTICFNKDDTDSGEDDDDHPYDIFHPSAGAANDRVRPTNDHGYDSDVTDPDNESIFTDEYDGPIPPSMSDNTVADTSDDATSDTNKDEQLPLPQRGDILYVPLASYYYTDGSGPSVPEPDKNWHVRQQIITAKRRGKNKRRKYVITGIDDFGDKYERDWDVWKREAAVKFSLGDDERLLEPHNNA